MLSISDRLKHLREKMKAHNVDFYLVPSIDAHNSEYLPECWQRRPWISNFDGSTGDVLVTIDHAYLWTDGRYFSQADQQLDCDEYTLMKQLSFVPEINQWLKENGKGKVLGVDAQTLSISKAKLYKKTLEAQGGSLKAIEGNLIDTVRQALGDNIEPPKGNCHLHDYQYTGQENAEKIKMIQDHLHKENVKAIALNALDEIAWLYNIRGNDIDFNPLVISYACVDLSGAWLFIDQDKMDHNTQAALSKAGIKLKAYESLADHLSSYDGKVWLDPKTANYNMYCQLKHEPFLASSPVVIAKACKNHVELKGAEVAHEKDAAAVISFLHWLDKNWQNGINELQCVNVLNEFRKQQSDYRGSSFDTISGFASNGAIIHYRVTPETSKVIDDSSLYLLDSGGQYPEGTTDITRTVHLGQPTAAQKRHYTLVLKGHLALSRQRFPHGTMGENLDVLARSALWNEGLNYRHGTGHGVGSFLCVHEGPQKISQAPSNVVLQPGMIVSNEPGYYIDGEYGIRIENLCAIQAVEDQEFSGSQFGPFCKFKDLTLVPYAKKLIDFDLLSDLEIAQLEGYYAQIRERIQPNLAEEVAKWLDQELSF